MCHIAKGGVATSSLATILDLLMFGHYSYAALMDAIPFQINSTGSNIPVAATLQCAASLLNYPEGLPGYFPLFWDYPDQMVLLYLNTDAQTGLFLSPALSKFTEHQVPYRHICILWVATQETITELLCRIGSRTTVLTKATFFQKIHWQAEIQT